MTGSCNSFFHFQSMWLKSFSDVWFRQVFTLQGFCQPANSLGLISQCYTNTKYIPSRDFDILTVECNHNYKWRITPVTFSLATAHIMMWDISKARSHIMRKILCQGESQSTSLYIMGKTQRSGNILILEAITAQAQNWGAVFVSTGKDISSIHCALDLSPWITVFPEFLGAEHTAGQKSSRISKHAHFPEASSCGQIRVSCPSPSCACSYYFIHDFDACIRRCTAAGRTRQPPPRHYCSACLL